MIRTDNFSMSPLFLLLVCLLSSLTLDAKVVKHVFEVSYFEGSPDGVHKDKILGINGQFPGPAIHADVGDRMEIDVINLIQDGQNLSMHWHGLHQRNQYCEDGIYIHYYLRTIKKASKKIEIIIWWYISQGQI